MLLAGASVNSASACGALTFNVANSPSNAWWSNGSANMLIAGASANNTPAIGGALTFNVNTLPSGAWWGDGSAKNQSRKKKTIS